ncbi:MAG: NADH-quinone oxidoreductase subunit N [Verrucomicrobiae bacterium]|nr:NADH-quinone oxidoreductase subunit N [Verrucomicrobiae bacterium]
MNTAPFLPCLPQIALSLWAFGLLAADAFWFRHWPMPRRNRRLGLLSALGYGLSIFLLLWRPVGEPSQSFGPVSLVEMMEILVFAGAALTALICTRDEWTEHCGELYTLLTVSALGLSFLVMARDLIMVFLCLELSSITLYALTAMRGDRRDATEAAFKYFLYGSLSSAFLLFGLTYLYGLTGTLELAGIAEAFSRQSPGPLLMMAMLFVVAGMGFKIAVVPFHLWAPDAYQCAPLPVAAFVASVSKIASVFILILFLGVLAGAQGAFSLGAGAVRTQPGWVAALTFISLASMVLGNFAALNQTHVRRLLAYSGIAHMGYLLIALCAGTPAGKAAALYYVIVYAMATLGTFGVLGVLGTQSGGETFRHLAGAAHRNPTLGFFLSLFVLSLAGIPPMAGFMGKFLVFSEALTSPHAVGLGMLWLVIIALLTSAVAFYYYLILLKAVWISEPAEEAPRELIHTPWWFNAAMGLLALLILVLGIFPAPLLEFLAAGLAHTR